MFSLLLVCLLAAPAINDALMNDDLLKINEKFVAVHEYSDNELLYAEKLMQVADEATEFEERTVTVLAEVKHVGREDVEVMFFPGADNRRFPQIRFLGNRDVEVNFYAGRSSVPDLGGSSHGGKQLGELRIEGLVSLNLAKKLRKGDKLRISGMLVEVKAAPDIIGRRRELERSKRMRDVAGFVIVPSNVERVSGEDAEGDGETVEK